MPYHCALCGPACAANPTENGKKPMMEAPRVLLAQIYVSGAFVMSCTGHPTRALKQTDARCSIAMQPKVALWQGELAVADHVGRGC
jgi:hypothetical protein